MGHTVRTVRVASDTARPWLSATVWSQVDWKKAERSVQNLPRSDLPSGQGQRGQQVRNLTKLLLRRYANRLVSVRRITQVNRGRHAPG